jgi:heat shock protein HtpX
MWEQVRSNKRRSIALVILIALLLLGLGFVIGEAVQPGAGILGLGIATLVWILMSLIAYFQGDAILLAISGAREITKEDHPQLFNVVEEMQIAGGLKKMPRVYLIDDMALNAFATGRDPDNAAVAVTAGLLGKLNRDALQGVIAHEMSHIINRDVLLMSMVGIMLGVIVIIAEVFLRGMWYGGGMRSRRYRSERGAGQGQAILIIVALVLAIVAPLLAQLIYFAISRRREYLADANAAVLTRYPEGLASALDVLAQDGAVLAHANKATAPMYIINPFHNAGRMALNLTSTHPPIDQRIRVLRSMGGTASFQQYDAAWRAVRGANRGVIPPSALIAGQAAPVRLPQAAPGSVDPRARMREAGDVLRKVNQFLFLTCACGLRIKLPPDFNKNTVACPRCHRELSVPVAQVAAAGQVLSSLAGQPQGPAPAAAPEPPPTPAGRAVFAAAPLEISRLPNQWQSFKCPCGAAINLSPSNVADHMTCNRCGRQIVIRSQTG